jgi:AraC-like DNA-binding protein
MQLLSDGSYAIDDVVSIEGDGISPFVFGRGWLLEIIEVESGEFYFFHDSEKVVPRGRRFGIFYPPFCFVRSYVKDLKGLVRSVGHTELLPGLPTHPVIFETDFDGSLASASDAVNILASAENIQSIEPKSDPSLVSIRAKRLIDENYLVFPSIARIAKRLKVSHAHLSRQFKRDFAMSPSEYLHQLRVAEATFRLSIGEPIIDISHEVGYNDLSRFYKQFRKNTRTSPAICREMLKAGNN